ncbi:MAG: cytochrome b N-terminal domain-containing protein [Armatimonadota bacterium]|nr:cytochrome b N-terminal domain-containing protein [Armatimonadota bacterium]MDR7449079.1 cytochrome b N-terminal domain-containing protein [Armatimonadota bacterium]MDR7459159.1 cytochrome b N-terminal domain-containing protein [Armatimonadota bacterium]MDR7480431.1 cytochrome b N-terminal domain-containing protein [Armatimonadota bacterium]MDR7489378.1 cytochrome b N-terminal domain-containing protein [Armatimonadota bacterium]
MGLVADWLRERKEHLDLFDETRTAQQGNPLYLLGPMIYFFWLVTVISGVILMLWYEPTTTGAYDSVRRIQEEIPLGWLVRGVHKYAADGIFLGIILRIYRMYFAGEYKRPGELGWMLFFLGLVLMMISGVTGYLLIWNQRSFWAAKTILTVPVYLDELTAPLSRWLGYNLNFGSMIAYVFLGGSAIGQATITRFYALHFGISLVLLVLIEFYFYRTRRKRLNMSLFPMALFLAMLVFISHPDVLPAELGRRADPNRTPLPILSDWYFLALYQYVKYTPPLWAGLGPGLLIGIGMLVPFLDRSRSRHPLDRPFFLVLGIWALFLFLAFTTLILWNIAVIEREPPLVLLTTAIVMGLGFLWHLLRRRRQLRAAAVPPAARPTTRAPERPAPAPSVLAGQSGEPA